MRAALHGLAIAALLAATMFVQGASAGEPATRLTLQLGFGGAVTGVTVAHPSHAAAVPAPAGKCPAALTPDQLPVAAPLSLQGDAVKLCFTASVTGVDVQFLLPAVPAVNFNYPRTLSCVTLKPRDREDVMVRVTIAVQSAERPVECDITRSFLYTLAIERHGSVAVPHTISPASNPTWQSTIEVPWTILHLESRAAHLDVSVFSNRFAKPLAAVPLGVTMRETFGAVSFAYAPLFAYVTPAPSSGKPAPRLHTLSADAVIGIDRHTVLAATFAQKTPLPRPSARFRRCLTVPRSRSRPTR
jgi:hypothetical protein